MSKVDFQNAFRMTVFYLELSHVKALETAVCNTKKYVKYFCRKKFVENIELYIKINNFSDVDEHWFALFNHLIFHSGFHEYDDCDEESMKCQIRLDWLQYCLACYEYDLRRSVNCLETIRDLIIAHDNSYKLILSNHNKHYRKIDLKTLNESIVMLERTISLNNVRQLYLDKKYNELISILKDSLINTTKTKHTGNMVMKISTQFEIILECFWNLELFEECLVWSERCLRYALDGFMDAKKDSALYQEWAKNTNFILTYIEAIILNESYVIGMYCIYFEKV